LHHLDDQNGVTTIKRSNATDINDTRFKNLHRKNYYCEEVNIKRKIVAQKQLRANSIVTERQYFQTVLGIEAIDIVCNSICALVYNSWLTDFSIINDLNNLFVNFCTPLLLKFLLIISPFITGIFVEVIIFNNYNVYVYIIYIYTSPFLLSDLICINNMLFSQHIEIITFY